MLEKVQDRRGKKDLNQKKFALSEQKKTEIRNGISVFFFFSSELSRVRFIKGIVQLRPYPQDKVHVYH